MTFKSSKIETTRKPLSKGKFSGSAQGVKVRSTTSPVAASIMPASIISGSQAGADIVRLQRLSRLRVL